MDTEVVVIGSGIGGSVTAGRLAEAGLKVTVLERGPWWDTVPTRSAGIENRAKLPRGFKLFYRAVRSISLPWLPADRLTLNKTGLFDLYFSKGMEVVCASGVGGGSHVYSAVHRRPQKDDYWDGHYVDLDESTMKPFYERFIQRVGSQKPGADNRPPHTALEVFVNDTHFVPAIPKVDSRVGFLLPEKSYEHKLVHSDETIQRWQADYNSDDHGFLGAPSGSKSSMDIVYLLPGMKKGLNVQDLCEVQYIRRVEGKRHRFEVIYKDLRNNTLQTLSADHVFVGAGTMNTLRLLLASRDKYKALTGMPGLGRRFSGNGDIRGFWDLNDKTRDFTKGLPSKGGILLKDNPHGDIVIGRNGLPSLSHYPFPSFVLNRLRHGMVVSGMGIDAMDGVASIRNGRFRIDFDPSNSPIYEQIKKTMKDVSAASGHRIYATRRPSTVHPLGGACVGRLEDDGVVASNGEVHGIPGLFVVDAAALPEPVGAGPSMTIGAWAENVASRFLDKAGQSAVDLNG
ncbi:GMC oxidoreductase [Castellaniella sp.]|uniref:GMC oxidoreductase n=1 Tax=Castellaniella sp. TaxID=1955812 RepID=UPI00356222C5